MKNGMNDDKEKWMDDAFQSMKGSQRAKPRPELFAQIEGQLMSSKQRVIAMYPWKSAVAAAVLMLLINSTALIYYNQDNTTSYEEIGTSDAYSQSLITPYQIYE